MKKEKNGATKSRKGKFGLIINIIFVALFVLVIISIFYMPGFWQDLADSMKNMFRPPEVDPLPWVKDAQADTRTALGVMNGVYESYKKVATDPKKACFGAFKQFDKSFFEKGFAIQVYPGKDKDGNDGISFVTKQYAKGAPTQGQSTIDTWTPVSSVLFIQGFKPCLVMGQSNVQNFYDNLVATQPTGDLPSVDYGTEKDFVLAMSNGDRSIYLSAEQQYIGYDSGKNNVNYFIFKYNNNICLIPAKVAGSWLGRLFSRTTCEPNADSKEFLSYDCLSNDGSKEKNLPIAVLLRNSGPNTGQLSGMVCDGFDYLKAAATP